MIFDDNQDSIIITKVEDVENTNLHHDNEEVNGFQGNESEIEKYYMEHPDAIENGLQIIKNQRSTSAGFIDIFAHDRIGQYVVIEIKQGPCTDRAIGQIVRYMGSIVDELRIFRSRIRGIILCSSVSKKMLYASHMLGTLTFMVYNANLEITPLQIPSSRNQNQDQKEKVVKLLQNTKSHTITIPVSFQQALKWNKNDQLYFTLNEIDHTLTLERIPY